ncbi:hypothetical protein RRG08_042974 [Elysia crispata]|uniref:Uncharacterized protein n=1 Tax=Elysia crispata TaxID=231223 RepID=A0AAE1AZ61_9GAST|nr:hypothetical protein RRG08_042974 [Elysia crispata]
MKEKGNGEEHEIVLEEHVVEKDLGVYVDNALSFKEHVIRSTAKANKVVGIIRRTFDFLTDDLLVRLYKSLVRPLLEYGHSVWQPQHKTLCSDVEDVQRRATKLLASIRDKPYPERLATLRLSPQASLPESVVTAPTVNCFKNRLDKHWENHPSLYNPQCAS